MLESVAASARRDAGEVSPSSAFPAGSRGTEPAPSDPGSRFLYEALAATAAIDAAERLGVLARLDAGAADSTALARDCGMSERGAQTLLAALAGVGILEASGDGTYRLPASGLAQVSRSRSHWQHLTAALRDGRPVVDGATLAGSEAHYPGVVPWLAERFAPSAQEAAGHLAEVLQAGVGRPGARAGSGRADALRVLDVGAGAAPWSLALAARLPNVRVTAVDLPGILPVIRGAVANAGRTSQFRCRSGDVFTLTLRRAHYDLAIVAHFCHLFDEATNRRLLARLFPALRPGGTLAIIDSLPNEELDGPRRVVLYALGLFLRTSQGRVYPFSTFAAWLRDSGYEAVKRIDLFDHRSLILITAQRPDERSAPSAGTNSS